MSKPIEPIYPNERITVPGHLLGARGGRGGDHYVLRVVGDSMMEESICDGDYVVVLRRDVADNGEMAVVIVGDEASIKRVYYEAEGSMIRLEPANPCLQPIRLPAKDVQIQGIVVGLMRKF